MSKEYLQNALRDNCLPSTMLFVGGGAKRAAIDLAAQVLRTSTTRLEANNHPDFHSLSPEGKGSLHAIDKIREAIEQSTLAPFEAKASLFLIEAADRMQPASANALLKTLEEPSPDSYWILLSDNPKEILPTIRSRCVTLTFREADAETVPSEECQILRSLLNNRPSYPTLALGLEKIEKLLDGEDAQAKGHALFAEVIAYFRDQARTTDLLPTWEEPFQAAKLSFERNVKVSTCLEYLFLSLASSRQS